MEYLSEILWLSLWPFTIYLGLKFSMKNILKLGENR